MCGRFLMGATLEELLKRYKIQEDVEREFKYGEIFPNDTSIVVVRDKQNFLKNMKWGFINPYNNRPIINARSETVYQKSMFKDSFNKRRCLIPVTAFYEWKKEHKISVKYEIKIAHKNIFSLAGIYNSYKNNKNQTYTVFTILTTSPSKAIEDIHGRMPVIINEEFEEEWLSNKDKNFEFIKSLMKPYQDSLLIKQADSHNDLRLF